jgi:hypothetical protein
MHDLPKHHHLAAKHDEFVMWCNDGESLNVA